MIRVHASTPFRTTRAALLTACLLSAGCSAMRPSVRATGATVTERGPTTARVEIALELRNEGSTEIELVQYDYMVFLEGGASYGGRWAALRALPPGQSVTATVPAVIPLADARAGIRWRASGEAEYRDPQSFARILYEAGILRTQSSFGGEGTLSEAAR